LSMRNYRRTLRIAEACYLDARHPRLLISMLNSPPANMLAMGTRRTAFRGLVRAAMSPLACLLRGACRPPTRVGSKGTCAGYWKGEGRCRWYSRGTNWDSPTVRGTTMMSDVEVTPAARRTGPMTRRGTFPGLGRDIECPTYWYSGTATIPARAAQKRAAIRRMTRVTSASRKSRPHCAMRIPCHLPCSRSSR
jgi:hypothetical protein